MTLRPTACSISPGKVFQFARHSWSFVFLPHPARSNEAATSKTNNLFTAFLLCAASRVPRFALCAMGAKY